MMNRWCGWKKVQIDYGAGERWIEASDPWVSLCYHTFFTSESSGPFPILLGSFLCKSFDFHSRFAFL